MTYVGGLSRKVAFCLTINHIAKEKAEIEEWRNEVENAISEISAIAKRQ